MFNWHCLEWLYQKPGICRFRDLQCLCRSKSTTLLLGNLMLILLGQRTGLWSSAHLAHGKWCHLSLGWARAWSLSHFPSQARGADTSTKQPERNDSNHFTVPAVWRFNSSTSAVQEISCMTPAQIKWRFHVPQRHIQGTKGTSMKYGEWESYPIRKEGLLLGLDKLRQFSTCNG